MSKAKYGKTVQFEIPYWTPLEQAVGPTLADGFMWMSEVRLDDGTRIDVYKHHVTRGYLHLAADKRAFVYRSDPLTDEDRDLYEPTSLRRLLLDAFDGWEELADAPSQTELDELARALDEA